MEFLKKSKVTEYEVQGETVKFKGIPLKTIFKIRNLAEANKSISKLLAYFFVDKSQDAEVITTKDGNTNIKAISPSIATMRMQNLEQGIAGIQSLFTAPETQELMAEIIYFSASECWKDKSFEQAYEDIMELDSATFLELLFGSLKASAGVVKVLGKLFPQIPTAVVDALAEKLKDLA